MSVRSAIRHLCALAFCIICGVAQAPQVSAQDYAAQYEEGLRKRDYVLLSQVFAGAAAQNNHAIASGALVSIVFTPLTTDSTQSCVSAIGEEKAQYLARVCGMISPATHPPCNISNSCKLIADEVVRGCQLAAQMGQPDAFCPPFMTMAGVVAKPVNTVSNTATSAAATGNKSSSAPIPATASDQQPRTGLVRWIMGDSTSDKVIGFTAVFLAALLVAYMIKQHGFWGGMLRLIKWTTIVALTIATSGLFLIVLWLWRKWTTTVCPKCKKRVSMDVTTSRYNEERRKDADREGEKWVERYTEVTKKKCPNCGCETEREEEITRDLGYTNKFAEGR